ncbi:MAG: biotin/lipoate A/B protein ligase family protein [Candidatus Nanosalina sp.]
MTRFIPFQHYNPYFKTGLNRALMESVRGSGETVIFLSGWKSDCVNIGYSQEIRQEVNLDKVKEQDILVVRRQGGGGTTYLTEDGEITWGIVAPEENFPDDVNKIYRKICGKIASGLEKIGIKAEHEPVNDVVTENGKISGATLKEEDGVVYIGGTILYKVNTEEMFQILTPDEDKLKDKQIKNFEDRITSIQSESDADFQEAVEALKKGLLNNRTFRKDELKDSEVERAEELADKYSSEEWLYRK